MNKSNTKLTERSQGSMFDFIYMNFKDRKNSSVAIKIRSDCLKKLGID